MIIPKKGVQKKYVIWGTNYGSNDNKFIVPGEKDVTDFSLGYNLVMDFFRDMNEQIKIKHKILG